ncbi:FAD-dependent oxidoreductase [Sphaerisporangium rufum]|uniref:FAD-dependent oxidoreductase n=1 Tax=Sphaerisporangium rufum TaxID=1381558 RepID=A0A919R146_9ACTN|nr:FAD-dependent monooxygenase [Sphaerisporangium rufum]GII77844.1 FAD-dependent oxidoreductase [Sphaerisporangium rufum]
MYDERVPVLVVGGGYAGLSAALLLAWRGVGVMVVERHPSTSVQPKAFGVNQRAMEMLRVVPGVEDDLMEISRGIADDMRIAIAGTLTDPNPRMIVESEDQFAFVREITPVAGAGLPQSKVERVLRAHAEAHGADLRFATELVSFEQDAGGVTVVVRDRGSGETSTVRAGYLIGADGHRSPVRVAAGIPVEGFGELGMSRSILFEADLSSVVDERVVTLWYLQNPDFDGAFITGTGVGVHVMTVSFDPARGQSEADFTEERCVELVRIGTGIPDLVVKIVDQNTWAFAHAVATRFSAGRVFLAGDAAHTMPPTGGQGGSTALQDGCDLAWRLALVISGQAGPGFLDAYDAERRPVGKMTADGQLGNMAVRMPPTRRAGLPEAPADPFAIILGCRYHSGAVLAEPGDDGSLTEDPRHLSGRPGGRAPHFAVVRAPAAGAAPGAAGARPEGGAGTEGREISVIDLFGRGFVLLTGPGADGDAWTAAADSAAGGLGVELAAYRVGRDLEPVTGGWTARYGITGSGAVLVRPDGYVAWRSPTAVPDPETTVRDVLAAVLARG